MRIRAVAACVLALALFACGGGASDAAQPEVPSVNPVLEPVVNAPVAHRGYSGRAPENTMASFAAAIAVGAKWVETDARLTADGQLVLMHDDDLQRTTNAKALFPDRAPWTVNSFTLAEIKQLDAGSWFNVKFAGERVPTLTELLSYLKGKDVGLHLEMKTTGDTAATMSAALVETGWIVGGKPTQRLIVTSFSPNYVRQFRWMQPLVETSVNLYGPPTADSLKAMEGSVHGIAIPLSAIDAPILTTSKSPLVQRVGVYTVDGAADMDRVLAHRFAYIFTNYVDQLQARIAVQP